MKDEKLNQRILSLYWQHARRYKRSLFFVYPMIVVAQIAEEVAMPFLVSGILTRLAEGDLESLQLGVIWPVLVGVALLELLSHSLWNVIVRVYWRMQDNTMRDLTMTSFDHLQTMSFSFFANRFAGSLVNQVSKFVSSFERLQDAMTWNVYKLIIGLIYTVVILSFTAPIMAVAIVVLSALFVPLTWVLRKRQVPFALRAAQAETARTGQLADTISNIIAVKSFSNEALERSRMYERASAVRNRSQDVMRINMAHEYATGAVQRSISIAIIVLSTVLAVNGVVEVGVIYLALTFTMAIMRRLWDLNNTFRQLIRVFGDASDMARILNVEPEVADTEHQKSFSSTDGSIEFRNVSFGYKDSDDMLFENLNISIRSGEKIGLVGPSGGGKTSVTKLLLRFMDIDDGEILIDGQNIADVTQNNLRNFVSYVPQEPLLFHRSIAENIAYGKLGASDAQIKHAAMRSNAHEFIAKLQDGYDTMVGERGVKLSGGQKQRVAIARSMIKDAPILVLDEATSALDSESEKLIQDALWKLMEDRTAIVIAHRLSTIQRMDRILVMADGKVVEQGTHDELILLGGTYSDLWRHQTGGFVE